MGLLDVLNGMQNGPRGQTEPGKGGMSPITMALLGLLAYKAVKSFSGSQPQANTGGAVPQQPGNTAATGGGGLGDLLGNALGGGAGGGLGGGGGLGDLLKGGLGGLLAGGAAGSVLTGGLNDLLGKLQQNGHGDVAKTWVGNGPNQEISPNDLEQALGHDTVNSLAEQAGLSKVALLDGLSQQLPGVVNHLTPQGRVPTEDEMNRMV